MSLCSGKVRTTVWFPGSSQDRENVVKNQTVHVYRVRTGKKNQTVHVYRVRTGKKIKPSMSIESGHVKKNQTVHVYRVRTGKKI